MARVTQDCLIQNIDHNISDCKKSAQNLNFILETDSISLLIFLFFFLLLGTLFKKPKAL